MAETVFAQTPVTLATAAVDGLDIFDASENPNVDGNFFVHKGRRMLVVRNNHATGAITCKPVVQRTVREGSSDLALDDLTPISVAAGAVFGIGPFSSNFEKAVDSGVHFVWAFAGGAAYTDVDVTVLDL